MSLLSKHVLILSFVLNFGLKWTYFSIILDVKIDDYRTDEALEMTRRCLCLSSCFLPINRIDEWTPTKKSARKSMKVSEIQLKSGRDISHGHHRLDHNFLLRHFPLMFIIFSCDPPSDPLNDLNGLHERVFIAGNSRFIGQDYLKLVMEATNDIMSSALNIHLQVIGFYIQEGLSLPFILEMKGRIYDSLHYNTAFLLVSESLKLPNLGNVSCIRQSVNIISVINEHDQLTDAPVLSKKLAGNLMMSLFFKLSASQRCSCSDAALCLSDDVTFETTSKEASSCFKDSLVKLMKKEEIFSSIYNDSNHACLWNRRPSSQESKMSILGNGVVETGEECDCHFKDFDCQQGCKNGKLLTTTATKDENDLILSSKASNVNFLIIIAVVLGVMVIIIAVLLFLRHQKILKDETEKQIDTEFP